MCYYTIVFPCGDDISKYGFYSIFTGTMQVRGSEIAVATILNSPDGNKSHFPMLDGSEDTALNAAVDFLKSHHKGCEPVINKIK